MVGGRTEMRKHNEGEKDWLFVPKEKENIELPVAKAKRSRNDNECGEVQKRRWA